MCTGMRPKMVKYREIYSKAQKMADILALESNYATDINNYRTDSIFTKASSYFYKACEILERVFDYPMGEVVKAVESETKLEDGCYYWITVQEALYDPTVGKAVAVYNKKADRFTSPLGSSRTTEVEVIEKVKEPQVKG